MATTTSTSGLVVTGWGSAPLGTFSSSVADEGPAGDPGTSATTTSAASSVSGGNTMHSVFSLGYIPTSKDRDFTVQTSGFFTLGEVSADTRKTGGLASALGGVSAAGVVDTAGKDANSPGLFWPCIITDISESHDEGISLHNTLSDSIVMFATGAKAVEMHIAGKVLVSGADDHLYIFLQRYVAQFRARRLHAAQKKLTFISRDTSLQLVITSITIGASIEDETYVNLGVVGLGHSYRMVNSREAVSYEYKGTARSVPTVPVTPKKEDAVTPIGKPAEPPTQLAQASAQGGVKD